MISGARARRVLVGSLIAAGWLAILGNSPGSDYHVKVVARTGDLTITTGNTKLDACSMDAFVSSPVRRFASFAGNELIIEVTCVDGSDCLSRLPDPYHPCEAIVGATDAGSVAVGREGETVSDAGVRSAEFACPGPPGKPNQLRVIQVQRMYEHEFCTSGSTTYRLEVDTAAGARTTMEYKLEEDPPPGYFGCG
jgi:hypothetical protein